MNSGSQPAKISVVVRDVDAELVTAVHSAMAAARAAQAEWARTPLAHRLKVMQRMRSCIADHAIFLAQSSANARQRPVSESLAAEVVPLADACRFLEREAGRILGVRRLGRRGRPVWLSGVTSEIHREPLGVVLVIGPGNYPLLLPGVQVIQALAAGNAVLLKPGRGGMPAARTMVEVLCRAGMDPRLVCVLPESPEAARAAIRTQPDKVLFTGSTATGEKILTQLAPDVIPAALELSGCDAILIRDDADLALVVKALVFGLTLNGGATCMSPKRVFVPVSRVTELELRMAESLKGVPLGEIEPVSETLRVTVNEAMDRGAHCISGGVSGEGRVSLPLALGGVPPDARLLRENHFLSIVSVVTVAHDQQAVACVNGCPFGLTAAIFSRNESAAHALARQIHTGAVLINDLIVPTADARLPFGGRGRSGFGVTRGAEGLLELTRGKVITVTRSRFRPAFDPPRAADQSLIEAYLKLAHGRDLPSRWAGLRSLIRILWNRNHPSRRAKQ